MGLPAILLFLKLSQGNRRRRPRFWRCECDDRAFRNLPIPDAASDGLWTFHLQKGSSGIETASFQTYLLCSIPRTERVRQPNAVSVKRFPKATDLPHSTWRPKNERHFSQTVELNCILREVPLSVKRINEIRGTSSKTDKKEQRPQNSFHRKISSNHDLLKEAYLNSSMR